MSSDTREIRELLDRYATALQTADADLAASLYTPDGVFYPYNLPTATGTGELRAAYRQIFDTIKLDVSFTVHEITVSGDVAVATTDSKGTVTVLAEQVTAEEANREVFVFFRADGAWRIARYMFNKAAAPGA
ncbi:DUF4440 domain-containing protein [Streptomyces sp. SW4]|nr:DUF4440 domain-containing protein [Streptomyces sp. SW4]